MEQKTVDWFKFGYDGFNSGLKRKVEVRFADMLTRKMGGWIGGSKDHKYVNPPDGLMAW